MTTSATSAFHSDVLVVGAGSAGSVVAERLSGVPDCRVTVLEAGVELTDPAIRSRVFDGFQLPLGAASPLVRRYRTELTAEPRSRVTIVRGGTVGGSGAVNGGYFCRALPRDFARMDLPGWTWREVLEHYRAIETDLDFDGPAHGQNGPISVRRTHEITGSTKIFVDAAERAGYRWMADLNDVSTDPAAATGVGSVPLNIIDGVRIGPGAAYLLPALARKNLTLLTRTQAVRVRIGAGRATGVEAIGPQGPVALTADRVVLCAGAIETAHLLMLSGIGPEPMLRNAGIDTVIPLPVGAHCTDHPEWVLPVDWPVTPRRPVLEAVLHTSNGLEIRPYTGGFVAMVGGSVGGEPDWPHLGVALMQPRSRGRLELVSPDPQVPLHIEHHYDSEPGDVATLRWGAQLVGEIVGSAAQVGSPVWSTSQHLCGSAPMGVDDDDAAVLDPQCRVRGVEGLWVVDGSALPRIPSRGPHATIVMAAHRAAEFVRGIPSG